MAGKVCQPDWPVSEKVHFKPIYTHSYTHYRSKVWKNEEF